jgi:hypothetical protein
MPFVSKSPEQTPLIEDGDRLAATVAEPSACEQKRNFLLNCDFMNRQTDFMCTVSHLIWIFIILGIVLGVIVMPIYLSKATSNTVTDDCVIGRCDGFVAVVQLVGFRAENVSVHTSSPCLDLVGETKRCFVKLGTANGRLDVSFERHDLVLGIIFGIVGWAILIPLIAWACFAMCRNAGRDKCGDRNGAFLWSFWTVIGLLIAFGVAVGVIAMPVVVTGGWRYSNENPVKDVCLVESCNAQNFGSVVAQTSKREATVYLRDCALHLRKSVTCYVTASPGLIVTYKPYQWVVIGLASTGWIVNAGLLTWLIVVIFRCLCNDLDKAIRKQDNH